MELKLKTPWRDGTTHLVMSPLECMQRLAALIPRPRLHLLRSHGVLAPNATLRALVVQQAPARTQEASEAAAAIDSEAEHVPARPGRISWARLLERVFDIDMQHCPNCGAGEIEIIAAILERLVIEKILAHLGLDPQPPPKAPAWGRCRITRAEPHPPSDMRRRAASCQGRLRARSRGGAARRVGTTLEISGWTQGTEAADASRCSRGTIQEQALQGTTALSAPTATTPGVSARGFQGVQAPSRLLLALATERSKTSSHAHQPHNLSPMRQLLQQRPDLPQVACFDTAMHRSNPPVAQMFALPMALHDAGVRRYGFHGLSYEYIASVLPDFDAAASAGRCVVLHLGNGASMCALRGGRSIAGTMGFTAVDGLPMATRCGAVDPGVMPYLIDELGMDSRAIEKMIYHESGLLGVSGVSATRASCSPATRRARGWRWNCSSTASRANWARWPPLWAGWMPSSSPPASASMRPPVRALICRAAAWLGVELDDAANAAHTAYARRIRSAASRTGAWVIPTNEELVIARHTRELLAAR